jgi:uncharacterized membrane protein YfcA
MNPIVGLFAALSVVTAGFLGVWGRAIVAARKKMGSDPTPENEVRFPTRGQLGVGFVTNFFDTLGIGSYAPTTSFFKLTKMVPDRIIPGTLTVGHTINTTVQTFIYTTLIEVDIRTLFSMIAAAVLGAWLGAGVVARWPKRNIQIGMGGALLAAAMLMLMTQLGQMPIGGTALGVTGTKFVIAVGVNFVLGALMTLGIGMYAPCMILVSLLGMNPKAAFPIMMGSCAFLMPVAAARFLKAGSFAMRPSLGLALGGVPAVLIAAFIVKELPLVYVRWLVIVVVVYAAASMLKSAYSDSRLRTAGAGAGYGV